MTSSDRWIHPTSLRRQIGPRCVYLAEAIAESGARLLKIGHSENLRDRISSLSADARTILGEPARTQCVALTYREGFAAALTAEQVLLTECGSRWNRLPASEWFEFNDEMRATVRAQLLADRSAWLAKWNRRQVRARAAGAGVRLTCSYGVRLVA